MEKQQKPILALRCKGCGAVYAAHSLCYPLDGELAEDFARWITEGDEPFIAYEVRLSPCKCPIPTEEVSQEKS